MHIHKNYVLICLILLLLILVAYTVSSLPKIPENFQEPRRKVQFRKRPTFIKIPRLGKMKHYRDIDQNAKLRKLEDKQRDLVNRRNELLNEKRKVENRVENIGSTLRQNGEYYKQQLNSIFGSS